MVRGAHACEAEPAIFATLQEFHAELNSMMSLCSIQFPHVHSVAAILMILYVFFMSLQEDRLRIKPIRRGGLFRRGQHYQQLLRANSQLPPFSTSTSAIFFQGSQQRSIPGFVPTDPSLRRGPRWPEPGFPRRMSEICVFKSAPWCTLTAGF